MTKFENPEGCYICGDELPEDPPNVLLPAGFGLRLTPAAGSSVRRIAFCSERHRRDLEDACRGEWREE